MAVKIRLSRHGCKKNPFYWIVAATDTTRRDGKFLEKLGTYSPKTVSEQDKVTVNLEALNVWRKKGAQMTETVGQLLKTLGK
jgi:small subunit ribosomal protein S16